ncbi:MAG: hypothetical protein AAB632_03200 [Patescibacteria group bacterium]
MDFVIKSGWTKTEKSVGGSGGRSVYAGDLEISGDSAVLQCKELADISLFEDLVPLEDWTDKAIEDICPVVGANTHCTPGSSNFHDDKDINAIRFTDGTMSVFLFEGSMAVYTFEDRKAPDMDLLIKAGILGPEAKTEREEDKRIKEALRAQLSKVQSERKDAQQSLSSAGRKDGHGIYRIIESLEGELRSIDEQLNREWKWADYVFDCHTILNWVPGMVDIFNWRERNHYDWIKSAELAIPRGQKIVAIHKIFEGAKEKSDKSQDVYSLEFESGAFSLPFGLLSGSWSEISLKSLDELGLIPEAETVRIQEAISKFHGDTENKKNDANRLEDLYKQLDEYGLGEKRTRKILAEITVLEAEDDNELHEVQASSTGGSTATG